MKIKTRLTLSVAIFAIALLIIIGSVIVTNQQVDRLNQQEELAKTIEIEANELSYLSSDYVLYRESQQAERWESKYSALASDLSDLAVDTPEQKVLVNNLIENQQRLRHVFDDIKSGVTGGQQGDPATDLAVVQVSWSRFAVQTQGIVFDAGRLSNLLRDEADQVKQVSNLLIFLLMGTFSLFILTSYLIVFRRTITSIADLQDGVKVIGSGDLNHVIPEKGDDEIRDLSRAFNQMTVDLKGVTASKVELEQEVANRKKAEEEVGERNEELTAINEELTKAGERVRKSEERYRNLFTSMTEGFALHEIVCDADDVPVDYRFLEINPAFEKLTALARDKVVGRLVSEVLPSIEPAWIETYGKVALTGTPVRFNNYSAPLDRHYEVYAFSPAPRQFAVLFSDITDRKRAEKELLQSYERTSTILESISDSFIAVDKHWRITYINRQALGYYNRPFGEVLGKIIWDVFPAIVGTPLEMFYREAMVSQEPLTFTDTNVVTTGKNFELHAYPMEDGLTIYGQDITERKRAEEALQESEAILRSFFDSSGVMRGIVEVIAEDDVLHITDNSTTASFVGLSTEAIKNKKGSELGEPPDVLRMWVGHYIESQKTGKPVIFEYRDKRGDAETWLHSTVSYLGTSPNGNPRFAYVVLDISERKRMEDNLREARMRTATILGGIADTFYSLDDQWRFVMVNPAAENAPFGRPAAELLGRVIWDLYPGLVGTRIHRHYLDAAEKRSLEHYVAQSPLNMRWYEVFMQGHKGGVDVYMRDITERKQAEEALRENDQRLNLSLEVSLMGTWDLDLVRHTAHRSLRHDQIFGYGELLPEWTYEMFLTHVIPEDRENVDRKFRDAIENKEDWNFECRILRKDGFLRWILARGKGGYDEGGKPVRMIGIVQDITERKLAEDALRESEEKYRNIVETANEGIIIVDAESVIIYVNNKFADMLGYQQNDLIGTSSSALFDKEYVALALAEREQRRQRGVKASYESKFIRRDGSSLWAVVNTSPLLDENDRFIGSLGMVTDITERRQAEQKIEGLLSEVSEEKDRLSALINSISDEIWFADTNRRFTLANPSAFLEFRLHHGNDIDVENLAGNLGVLRPDGTPRSVDEAPPLRALGGEIVRNQEEIVRTPGHGELRYRQVSSTPVRDNNRNIIGSVSVVRDITEFKRTEEKLRDTSRYLENLLDYANAPIIVWDPAFRITRFNHAFERLTGRKTSDVIGKHLEILFPEKYAGTAMDIIRRTTRGERLDVVEIPILHVDGTVRTVLWNSATLFEADGKTVLSTIAQGSDITERKRAEEELLRRNEDLNAAYEKITATQEELQQSNDELIRSEQELRKTSQYLENLIDYANAPIVVWDPQFVITRFNRAFEELMGRTAREIIGQRLEVLFPQRYLDASMAIIRKTMKGERLKVVEIPILNRRGEIRIVLWNSATLFEADGTTVQSTIAQGNDITERKMTEAELEERNEELQSAIEELTRQGHELNEALNEKEVLLSEVHHRVKNNLTAFISLLSLESAYDDTPAGLALKKDLQNRARSMALIHETLYRTKKYSRVNMDVYLSTLVGQVVSSYESGKSIQTGVETNGITLDLSRATPGGLIINELLTNSLKYAFPPSFDCEKIRGAPCMITVSLTEDDGSYILTVADNGVGLPKDFDIASTKTLGLKLVNFLARHQLRASVEVHSYNGAEFRFRFQDKV